MKIKVGLYYSENGYCTVEANSKEEAENMVYKKLEEEGLQGMEEEWQFKAYDREYNTMSLEEIANDSNTNS